MLYNDCINDQSNKSREAHILGYQLAIADLQNIINDYIGSLSQVKCSDVGLDHKYGMCYINTNNLVIDTFRNQMVT